MRPVFWARLVGVSLLLITAYAYYLWYQVLVARGFGYVFNAGKYLRDFQQARLFLLIVLGVGVVTYELTWQHLTKSWRICYVIILGLGIAHFVVQWLVEQFGPTPFWHHP